MLECNCNSFGSVPDIELLKDLVDMVSGGILADISRGADLFVGKPLEQQFEDFKFTDCQMSPRSAMGKPCCNVRRKVLTARSDGLNSLYHLPLSGALKQVTLRSGGDGGINLHRDHSMVSVATTAAFHWAGRVEFFPEQLQRGLNPYSPQKLYYANTPFVVVRDRPELAGAATVPWSLTLELSGDLAATKLEAIRRHSTQAGVLERIGDIIRKHLEVERYLLAAAPGRISVAEDAAVFSGVVPD